MLNVVGREPPGEEVMVGAVEIGVLGEELKLGEVEGSEALGERVLLAA